MNLSICWDGGGRGSGISCGMGAWYFDSRSLGIEV